jgi:hypothetical protein
MFNLRRGNPEYQYDTMGFAVSVATQTSDATVGVGEVG